MDFPEVALSFTTVRFCQRNCPIATFGKSDRNAVKLASRARRDRPRRPHEGAGRSGTSRALGRAATRYQFRSRLRPLCPVWDAETDTEWSGEAETDTKS